MDITNIVQSWILKNLNNVSFEAFSYFCGNYRNEPSHNFLELKKKNTKTIGDIFEAFCKLYLKYIMNYETVWLYNEIPNDIKKQLKLTNRDMGIDILVIDGNNTYAIQCKYRNRNKKNIGINWKDLSTFYALTYRTGPYDKIIIMTNADYVKRIGNIMTNEMIINFNVFNKMLFKDWFNMCNGCKAIQNNASITQYSDGRKLGGEQCDDEKDKKGFLREQRLKYFDSL